MKSRVLFTMFLLLTLSAIPARAQSDAIEGTWSGHWVPDGGVRDAVTVRFSVDGSKVTGEIVNPENIAFDSVSFDGSDLSLVAEAKGGQNGNIRIEARIEEETRLNGKLMYGATSGEMKLTKWTYVPRIR